MNTIEMFCLPNAAQLAARWRCAGTPVARAKLKSALQSTVFTRCAGAAALRASAPRHRGQGRRCWLRSRRYVSPCSTYATLTNSMQFDGRTHTLKMQFRSAHYLIRLVTFYGIRIIIRIQS